MMTAPYPPTSQLAPHAPPMLLVDRVIEFAGNRLRSECSVKADNPFFVPGRGLPAYVGFELMAQTISIFDGARRHENGDPPAIGFLLGCRRYKTTRDWLNEGERVEIEVTSLLEEGELRSFDCRMIASDGSEIATGAINVYRPEDPAAYLDQAGQYD